MTALWTIDEVVTACGGRLLSGPSGSAAPAITGVTFDSREVGPGDLFIALKGTASDGHSFVGSAVANGAVAVLVSDPQASALAGGASVIGTDDTFAALQALGRAARARTKAVVIGVTGSVGKTGTKEALLACLERFRPGRVHASVKSYNNHTGVPLSLARCPRDVQFAIFEMGMNHAGELADLTCLVRPHVAAITAIASAHVENFSDGEHGVARAKAEIFQGLEPGGTAVINRDTQHFAVLADAAEAAGAARVMTASMADQTASMYPLSVARQPAGTALTAMIDGERLIYKVALAGDHWVANSLLVLGVVKAAGGDLGLAGLALAEMQGLEGRGRQLQVAVKGGGSAWLFDDCYNANPASMAAALAVLGGLEKPPRARRIAVLGAMKELGPAGPQLHAALADPVLDAGVDIVLTVGAEMAALRSALESRPGSRVTVISFDTPSAVLDWLGNDLRHQDQLLVKGSNSVGLSSIVKALESQRQTMAERAQC